MKTLDIISKLSKPAVSILIPMVTDNAYIKTRRFAANTRPNGLQELIESTVVLWDYNYEDGQIWIDIHVTAEQAAAWKPILGVANALK